MTRPQEADLYRLDHAERYRLVGRSPRLLAVLAEADRLASIPRPVLVRGERGTGKELLAARIHYQGARALGPFVVVNCGGLSDELLAAELFGHAAGAYTGAVTERPGRLELADGGTLFLDEVGNMSPAFQELILRVIEYQQFERVGDTRPRRVDVRIVAATNADLDELMARGQFRRDLHDRLSFAVLTLPPLREHREDIPLLVEHFTQALHAEVPNLEAKSFSPEAVDDLVAYYWPGNVRQLKSVVENVLVRETDNPIRTDELPAEIGGLGAPGGGFEARVEHFQKTLLLNALRASGFNQKQAARDLELSYDQFRHYYRKFDLKDYAP